jgi:undecaprenyl diphosphate synthase
MLQHLACVMDGNRRWAKKRGLFPWDGHREGVTTAQRTVDYCLEKNIPYLTLYTFSVENLKRSLEEKSFLFDLIARFVTDILLVDYRDRGVCVKFIGDRSLFPERLRSVFERVERETAHGAILTVHLLFCYGGQQEIVAAARELAERVARGELTPEAITQELFASTLWTGSIPAPDLVIRTGGNQRLSNFLSYQSAYSELYFSDTLWPDVDEAFLNTALSYFESSKRNFGA